MAAIQVKDNFAAFVAGEDLSSSQYCFVKLGTAEGTVVANASGAGIGILQNAPTEGQTAIVAMPGSGAKLLAGGIIALGAVIKPSTSGKGVLADTDKDFYGARALEASAADGNKITVVVCDGYVGV